MRVGDRLSIGREALGLTQSELSRLSGVPLSTIKKYEGSHTEPGREALERFVRAGINANWLVVGAEPILIHPPIRAGRTVRIRDAPGDDLVEHYVRQATFTRTAERLKTVDSVWRSIADLADYEIPRELTEAIKTCMFDHGLSVEGATLIVTMLKPLFGPSRST